MSANGSLFISDIHLGSPEFDTPALERSLIRLVEHAAERNLRIVLLGDVFDYWMEYPDGIAPPLGKAFLTRMERLHIETGSSTLYLTGNHDNWILGHFRDLGFDVESEYRILELHGRCILATHGDGLASPEWGFPRPLSHRVLRHPRFAETFRMVFPPGAGWSLMRWYADQSRRKPDRSTDDLDAVAGRWLRREDIDMVVCGHDHVARMIRFDHGEYVNCGAFGADRSAALLTDDGARLVTWVEQDNILRSATSP